MKKCRSCQQEIDDKAKKCPYCQEKQGSWLRRHPVLISILGVIVFLIVIGNVGGGNDKTSQPEIATPTSETTQGTDNIETTPIANDEKSSESTSQKNAVRKANSYLGMTGFSRSGLIKQLEFEKFSTEDATYAVDTINPDWNEQAARKAESYNDLSGFSRDGLIKQLEFEGFTAEQAVHGADSVGL